MGVYERIRIMNKIGEKCCVKDCSKRSIPTGSNLLNQRLR